MAPDMTTVTIDIRVPPTFITDPAVLDNFPELCYSEPGSLATFYPPRSHRSCPNTITVSKQENISSPAKLKESARLLPGVTDDVISENTSVESPTSYGEADDLFDSEYVLPDNCQWWEQVEDLSYEAPPGDLEIVDLPHFGNNLNYSGLWEDVDSYVSVVDVTDDDIDDVTEERPLYEPVFCLDTRKTTVWGLDIIWEEDECIIEMLE